MIDPLFSLFSILSLNKHMVNRLVKEIGPKEINEAEKDKMAESRNYIYDKRLMQKEVDAIKNENQQIQTHHREIISFFHWNPLNNVIYSFISQSFNLFCIPIVWIQFQHIFKMSYCQLFLIILKVSIS